MRTIKYGIDTEGTTYSRVGDHIAYGVLDYENMRPENNYEMNYFFNDCSVHSLSVKQWNNIHWTRKLPLLVKNQHRKYWRFPELTNESVKPRWYLDWGITCRPNEKEYTAPSEIKEVLVSLGAVHIRRTPAYNNKEIGCVWVFDLETNKYTALLEALADSQLRPVMCRWAT